MKSITKNTLYLYALTASNYLFGILTIPFITRILGPEAFGSLGFAIAIGVYFNLFIDFGFLLSGTKRVAESACNHLELSKIFSSITYIKVLISLGLLFILIGLNTFIQEISDNFSLIFLYLLVGLFSSILPDYLYRGLEDMKKVTIRSVIARGIFTILIILFLRSPSQILLIPTFNIVGSIIAFVWVYLDLYRRYNVCFCKPDTHHIMTLVKESSEYFLSRIAASIYNASNTVILGFVFPGQAVVGYYSSAEKFWGLSAQAVSPISDSYYPYMIRTKDFARLFKVTVLFEIPILICCVIGYIWSESICELFFGKEFSEAYIILRLMIPIIAIILPTYMLGFPALTPLGLSKWANRSIEVAMINQIIGLVILFGFGFINVVSLCILTNISQFIVLAIRLSCVIINRKNAWVLFKFPLVF